MSSDVAILARAADRRCLAFDPFEYGKGDDNAVRLSDKMVTAAKAHTCNMCDAAIVRGERSRAITEAYEGTVMTFRFCAMCCKAMAASWGDDGRALDHRHALRERRRGETA